MRTNQNNVSGEFQELRGLNQETCRCKVWTTPDFGFFNDSINCNVFCWPIARHRSLNFNIAIRRAEDNSNPLYCESVTQTQTETTSRVMTATSNSLLLQIFGN